MTSAPNASIHCAATLGINQAAIGAESPPTIPWGKMPIPK